jgi:hypothetical protein
LKFCSARPHEPDQPSPPRASGAAELRQQRIALARLIAALRIPTDASDGRSQARPLRGVYGIAGGRS